MTRHAQVQVTAPPRTLPKQRLRLSLLGDWRLERNGLPIPLLHKDRQLMALLALQGSRQRSYVAGVLWPDVAEARARASLRQVIARIRREVPEALVAIGDSLSLEGTLSTDVATVNEWCRRVHGLDTLHRGDAIEALQTLSGPELLVGEFDDWVLLERERLQRNRILALEVLALLLSDLGELPYAVAACEIAAGIDPLRETPVRVLMSIHLKHGNRVDARHAYDSFRLRLQSDLDEDPSPGLGALLDA
jgi:DNA-binding SARP family transcriptional activator